MRTNGANHEKEKEKGKEREIEDHEDVMIDDAHPHANECAQILMKEFYNLLTDIDKIVLEIASIFGNRTLISAVIDVSFHILSIFLY